MKLCSGTDRHSHTAVKKTTMLMALFAAVFLVALFSIADVQQVYAAGDTVLTVKLNGEIMHEFTADDLDAIAVGEGDRLYTYSSWNTYPTYKTKSVNGPSVLGILKAAGVYDSLSSDSTLLFTDGAYKASFTKYQLLEEPRYYYPNGKSAKPTEGPAPEESYEGAVKVDAIVFNSGANDGLVLLVGQAAPNDENNPAFVQYLNTIDISTAGIQKCDLPVPSIASDSFCSKGQTIDFGNANKNLEYVYYTLDGSEPDYGSQLYNSGMNQGIVTAPKLPDYGDYTIKVKVKGYGKADSDVGTYTYHVRPETPAGISVSAEYNQISLSWSEVPGAERYNVYRSVAGGDYALCASVGTGTLTLSFTPVTAGTLYSFKVTAVGTAQDGSVFESNFSQAASIVAPSQVTPVIFNPEPGPTEIQDLKAVKISKPKAAKKKVTVKWKKVSKKDQKKIGGIEIQVATDSDFVNIVKSTTAQKSRTSKTIKGLRSKTTYWVRIRAYKNAADGKHVSAWKTKKVKVK
ncbi:MAG: chitobiase/beta-hexosaminidase C-terminal domain-containing protein [Mogibacterium sp.]|nr:chitobiase/beta-hexosaminidase C-terminal domain-containing protein [Mogibacterium sp.]